MGDDDRAGDKDSEGDVPPSRSRSMSDWGILPYEAAEATILGSGLGSHRPAALEAQM